MLTPEKIKAMNAVSGLNVPLDPTAPPSRAQQVLDIGKKAAAMKQAAIDAAKPKLGQGAAGEFAGNTVRSIVEPLQKTGAFIESGLDKLTGSHTAEGVNQAVDTSEKNHEDTLAGHIGDFVGTVAPYLTGAGEEETAAKVAAAVPKIAEALGIKSESLLPKIAAYIAKSSPAALKNTAVGTAQTGNLKEGAEIGVGGQLASDAIAPLAKAGSSLASQALGVSTGSGASSIRAGFDAAKDGSRAFTNAMRGKTDPDEIVHGIQDAVQNIANNRRSQYLSDLENIKNPEGGGLFSEYTPEGRVGGTTAENTRITNMGFSPDENVTVYRGVPKGVKDINPGDWVTTNRQLAKDYAGTGDVLTKKVKAAHLLGEDGDSALEELVYSPVNAKKSMSIDISPINDTLQTQLKNFGVKVGEDGQLDFSRSSIANNSGARSDIQGVYDTLKDWGSQGGDRTPVGLDTLKKQLGDFYSDSGSARAFVQSVKGKVGDILKEKVPGYDAMTKNYAKASALLDDIKSATGAGGNAKVDTVFTKLTTAMKGDKDLRLEVLREAMNAGGIPDLEAKIAGINMNSLTPKGLVGKGADVGAIIASLSHVLNPSLLPTLLSTSPRVVGEFVNALGIGAKYATKLNRLIEAAGATTKGIVPGSGAAIFDNSNENNP